MDEVRFPLFYEESDFLPALVKINHMMVRKTTWAGCWVSSRVAASDDETIAVRKRFSDSSSLTTYYRTISNLAIGRVPIVAFLNDPHGCNESGSSNVHLEGPWTKRAIARPKLADKGFASAHQQLGDKCLMDLALLPIMEVWGNLYDPRLFERLRWLPLQPWALAPQRTAPSLITLAGGLGFERISVEALGDSRGFSIGSRRGKEGTRNQKGYWKGKAAEEGDTVASSRVVDANINTEPRAATAPSSAVLGASRGLLP
ncbi:hypothetical protein HYFRA_00004189 [Hymenoscyphus fraxineus]|uniref:Uncharacterized protein n=1 Tax=Hymenoscyphus fraxineus TaxID=746836 RepID=A0A9N9KPT4_9HELO|nr:hypothetical protein HYFRA_00004189 [Hymenoscyphus fraxineus]